MASHGSISSSSFPLLLLLQLSSVLVIFFSCSSTQPIIVFVNGNDALIGTVCSKTVEPVICSECLKSDPKSKSADVRGLAGIANNCAATDANQLYEETYNFTQTVKDPTLKDIAEGCTIQFLLGKDDFHGVQNNLDVKAYEEAKSILINQILPKINYCIDQFDKKPKLQMPPKLLAGTNIVKNGIDVMIGILNYLISID
ncbi:Pectinesterase inhibitor domain [Macleaya cordata]|uniref:Pectinesterase inhibitor domain n=1 Tax=Macleaya cordata TaxID=56857 RepID=A0A200QM59_MACCD|nr:Pectinesterase inhibitor domain [Macleaya cordata]